MQTYRDLYCVNLWNTVQKAENDLHPISSHNLLKYSFPGFPTLYSHIFFSNATDVWAACARRDCFTRSIFVHFMECIVGNLHANLHDWLFINTINGLYEYLFLFKLKNCYALHHYSFDAAVQSEKPHFVNCISFTNNTVVANDGWWK